MKTTADYNPIAWFYDRHWSSHYHPWALAVLDQVLFRDLPAGAAVLDICCGNGVLAAEMLKRGFRVTGVDHSEQMLDFARQNAPEAHFALADVRSFSVPGQFDAAVSTFDSLNHILTTEELLDVFRNAWRALRPGARFVFDLNLEQRYVECWGSSCSTIDEEHACFIRGRYDPATRTGETMVSLFRYRGKWEREDLVLLQRCHPADEVLKLLRRAGFARAECHDAISDLGIEGDFGRGRGIFVATA